ncbi:PREDICTED: UPF0481 protein At3g47200-like [Ipomoea nil]|uniref:UPF0481 protein At3g47200-like n=1 Tax=Ipomoea nil TaxID=35883 RepID=UPI000900C858|nr:PREDICTED: UPF0481 protein At3g47200-like [Ipomoea nil]
MEQEEHSYLPEIEEEEEEYCSELLPQHVMNIIAEENGEGGISSIGRGGGEIPQLVSIGPNHFGNPKLSEMETHKAKLLDVESRRWSSGTGASLTNALLEMEGRARKWYSHYFNHVDGDAFVKMLLTDSFFIINLFMAYDHKFYKGDGELANNLVFTTRWMLPTICEDLLMLDNQLPFFILAKVYVILTNNEPINCLKKLALQFFKQVQFGKVAVTADVKSTAEKNPKHLLDLFHSSFLGMDKGDNKKSSSSTSSSETKFWVQNTSTLRSKGVTFIARREARRPLDIQFSWLGVLRIPTFCIDDTNVSVLKNLLAYEQGSRRVKPYFSSLTVFLSNIAATPGDVKFLRETGIIQHQPGNDNNVVVVLQELYKLVTYSFDDDCLIKCQVEHINRFVTYVPGEVISYMKRMLLPNFVHLVVLVLCVALLFFVPHDTFKHFRIIRT